MKEEEKQLIIELLFNKYKENKDEKILKLIDKVRKTNFVANHLNLTGVNIRLKDLVLDFRELFFEELDLSNRYLWIEDKKIKVLSTEEFKRRRNIHG